MLNVAVAVDPVVDSMAARESAAHVISQACEAVLGEGRCPVAKDLRPGEVAAWHALVRAEDRSLHRITIEFRDRAEDGVLIESRTLAFSPADGTRSRYVSAGTMIASLAAAREGSLVQPVHSTNIASTAAEPPPDAAPPQKPVRPALSLGAAAIFAPGIGGGPQRFGVVGQLHLLLGTRAFLAVDASYAEHSSEPALQWWTAALGGGVRLLDAGSRFHIEPCAELIFQRTLVRATRDARTESAGENGWGGALGLNAVWWFWRPMALVAGIEGALVLPRIHVIVGRDDAATVPTGSLIFLVGARVAP